MRQKNFDTDIQDTTLILCSYAAGINQWDPLDYEEEFKNLVKSSTYHYDFEIFMRLRQIDSANFFTKGKMAEIVSFCSENKIERIILSSSLSSMQHRNLSALTGTIIIDRTDLILHIFKNSAISSEGKLQVEIAELNIKKTRISGLGREMGQQQHGVGSRGPGETEKETLYRLYSDEILKLERKIKTLETTKNVQRKKRLKSGLPIVALVGYTNAGKSSLLNRLSGASVFVEDKLFATLDTTTKEVFLAEKKKILLSDTVGFISELPHHLVKAFQSTLQELKFANLLLHVVDIANQSWPEQIQIVQETLEQIEITKPMLFVFNKIDKVETEAIAQVEKFAKENSLKHVFISTQSAEAVAPLKEYLKLSL